MNRMHAAVLRLWLPSVGRWRGATGEQRMIESHTRGVLPLLNDFVMTVARVRSRLTARRSVNSPPVDVFDPIPSSLTKGFTGNCAT
jgi:hypothetical protein